MNKTQVNVSTTLLSMLKFWGQGAIEILFYFPVIFIIDLLIIPTQMQWLWLILITLFYLAGSMLRTVWPVSKRWQQILAALVVSGIVSLTLFHSFGAIAATLLPGAFAMRRGMFFVEVNWSFVFPTVAVWTGLIVYFFAYIVYLRFELLYPYAHLLTWFGMASLAIALFRTNSSQLQGETYVEEQKQNVSAAVFWANRLLVAGLLSVIFIIAYFRQIKIWLYSIVGSILQFIFSLVPDNVADTMPLKKTANMPKLKAGAHHDASLWDTIFFYLTFAVSTVVILFTLYLLIRGLIKIILRVYAWFMQSVGGSKAQRTEIVKAYTDEKTNLFRWKELGHSFGGLIKDWFAKWMEKEPRWEDLQDNKERIRYLYRHFVMRGIVSGYSFKPFLTAKETAQDVTQWDRNENGARDVLIGFYHEARYGDKEPEVKDIEKLKRDVVDSNI